MKNLSFPRLLADATSDIFGTVKPPVSIGDPANPASGVGQLLTFLIQIILLVGGLAALIYLLWGAFDWITSSGEKDKLQKAQQKMMNAVLGLLLIIVSFTVFSFFMGTVLGGKFGIGGDFTITLPRLGN